MQLAWRGPFVQPDLHATVVTVNVPVIVTYPSGRTRRLFYTGTLMWSDLELLASPSARALLLRKTSNTLTSLRDAVRQGKLGIGLHPRRKHRPITKLEWV